MEEIKKPDNPSVYPDPMRGADQSYSNQNPWKLESGMTLRDYFAAKAMAIYIQDHLKYKRENENGWSVDSITDSAYVFADAMLKQRES